MTTEEDFQRALDLCPEDAQTRLVFADWLEERGDARAAGYRALGTLRVRPCPTARPEDLRGEVPPSDFVCPPFAYRNEKGTYRKQTHSLELFTLPNDWLLLVPDFAGSWTRDFDTRREAEDAAARAFLKLPADRQAELLAVPATV